MLILTIPNLRGTPQQQLEQLKSYLITQKEAVRLYTDDLERRINALEKGNKK